MAKVGLLTVSDGRPAVHRDLAEFATGVESRIATALEGAGVEVCRCAPDRDLWTTVAGRAFDALLIARQKEALRQATGSWKDKDHPELKAGAAAWARKLRRESEARFKKQFRSK